jgi:hypothetical protein
MPIFRLAPIDIRADDENWAASNLEEGVWVEARDDLDARHQIEAAEDARLPAWQKLLFSPWLDDVVTSCQIDREAEAPSEGYIRTDGGKLIKLP